MDMPKDVRDSLKRLEDSGFDAYIVGGAVRDYLLDRQTNDYDIATSARPEEIQEVFKDKKCIEVGKSFGTIVVVLQSGPVEITTFRIEDEYDGRRPHKLSFSKDLKEDLKRRDFTINAMAYRPGEEIVDIFAGKEDLEKKLIRTVGDPKRRISEDYLRIMRAVRFASQLNFSIDEKLSETIIEERNNLKLISKERIREEFNKILLADKPSRGIGILKDLSLLEVLSKDLANMVGFDQRSTFHDLDLYEHTMKALDNTDAILELRLAALFHDAGKPATFFLDDRGEGRFFGHQAVSAELAEKFLKEYRYPKDTIHSVTRLIERHMDNTNTYTKKSVRKLISRMEGDLNLLFKLQEADVRATNQEVNLENIELGKRLAKESLENNIATNKSQLEINGNDLIDIGFKEGKVIGECLDFLLDKVMEDDSLNNKEGLLKLAKKHYGGKN